MSTGYLEYFLKIAHTLKLVSKQGTHSFRNEDTRLQEKEVSADSKETCFATTNNIKGSSEYVFMHSMVSKTFVEKKLKVNILIMFKQRFASKASLVYNSQITLKCTFSLEMLSLLRTLTGV